MRRFNFNVDLTTEKEAPIRACVVFLDETGQRALCDQNFFIPEPKIGDQFRDRIVIKIEHWMNGVGAHTASQCADCRHPIVDPSLRFICDFDHRPLCSACAPAYDLL